jgi:hypothetical protein
VNKYLPAEKKKVPRLEGNVLQYIVISSFLVASVTRAVCRRSKNWWDENMLSAWPGKSRNNREEN